MPNQLLTDYIKQARLAGQSDIESKKILQNNGWPEKEIDEAFQESSPRPDFGKNKLPLKKILLISLVGIFVLAAGTGAAYYYYTENTPEIVIKKAIDKIEDIKTYHFRAELKITGKIQGLTTALKDHPDSSSLASLFSTISQEPSPETQGQSASITVEGDVDAQDEQNLKLNLEINLETPKAINVNLKMGFIVLDEKFYFKINEVSAPEGQAPIDLGEFKDKWIRFDLEELAELSGQEELKEEMEKQRQTSLENIEKMQQLLQESEKMFIIKDLGDTEINGIKAHRYDVNFDKQELINFITKAIKLYQQDAEQQNEYMPSTQELREFVERLTSLIKIELWIGKKDKFIHKILLTSEELEIAAKIKTSLSLEITLSNFNQPINFTEPKDTKGLKEILGPFWNLALGGAQSKARDARGQADLRMIQTALEMDYTDNMRYKDLPDTSTPIGPNQNISDYLTLVPQNAENPENPYYWYDNGDNSTYCVYYKHEATPETYFYVSSEGAGGNNSPGCKP